MAATSTIAIEAQTGQVTVKQVTSSAGIAETADLINGTANGRRIREVRVMSGAIGPDPGTVIMLKIFDGSTSGITDAAICPGGPYSRQATFFFNGLILPSTAHAFRAQLSKSLGSGASLDFTFIGENF
jgi:hypothetical protein